MILASPRFQKLQGRHIKHVSGLHWTASYFDPDASPLASFPNLESLHMFEGNRRFIGRSPHSEWYFMVPAATREGWLPVCLPLVGLARPQGKLWLLWTPKKMPSDCIALQGPPCSSRGP